MVKMLGKKLLESNFSWAARDVIVSDIFEMFKSQEMLASFQMFFVNKEEDHFHSEGVDSLVKFQMCDQRC